MTLNQEGSSDWLRRRRRALPPLRPGSRASSLVHLWAVPLMWGRRPATLALPGVNLFAVPRWWAVLPPLLPSARRSSGLIAANPRGRGAAGASALALLSLASDMSAFLSCRTGWRAVGAAQSTADAEPKVSAST